MRSAQKRCSERGPINAYESLSKIQKIPAKFLTGKMLLIFMVFVVVLALGKYFKITFTII